MTAETRKPRKILAVADAGDGRIALESALALADTHGAAVEVMACVEPPHDLSILSRLSGEDPDRLIADAVEHTYAEVRSRLSSIAPNRQIDISVAVGKAYLEIIRHVARSGCDFVIKTAEPLSGMDRFLFASTDQHLLRKCPCPVWLQTPSASRRPLRILAAVDLDTADAAEPQTLTDLNRRVIDAACAIAEAPNAEVVVLHAWEAMGEGMIWAFSGRGNARMSADKYVNEILDVRQAAMDRFLAQLRNEIGPRPRLVPRLARGTPETVIHAQSRQVGADVVVMGTVARTGLSGVFIGNTAENIINSLECPVLAVKPEGFVSPLLRG
ncbi:Universal stress protein family 1 [Roseibacterium elongatum DSM 19469]|uniref:Universal stress protein family 1 n=1 Tax=Roseicyclus elongatus DSM 19469 TaxID=1294273 RepID=W8RTH0_9RHOB|nr:universal stress protein [Roseibacterium elongatum]AHM04463.1 Universal stress protein family 1 [Roseibacterium elongatum DSM 19469]